VPEAREVEAGPGTILLEQPIDGRQMAALLGWRQESVPTFIARITDWLVHWNRNTLTTRIADRGWIEEQLLQPAAALPSLRERPAYLAWLQEKCARLAGQSVPVVAAHNDLTMSNLLLTAEGRLGVLDWEAAGERLPLTDLFYTVVDAASAQNHYRDRLDAFRHCLEVGGRWYQLVNGAEAKIRGVTGTGPEIAALAFHVCWLQHAAAEAAKRLPDEPRPFLRIVERIVDLSLRWD
jgi:thiamine kinase-like enzyme